MPDLPPVKYCSIEQLFFSVILIDRDCPSKSKSPRNSDSSRLDKLSITGRAAVWTSWGRPSPSSEEKSDITQQEMGCTLSQVNWQDTAENQVDLSYRTTAQTLSQKTILLPSLWVTKGLRSCLRQSTNVALSLVIIQLVKRRKEHFSADFHLEGRVQI